LNLDRKTLLTVRSERVKCIDFHPTELWVLVGLYDGTVNLWDYENNKIIRSFSISSCPVRCVRFIPRKNWFVAGTDDFHLRVCNYLNGDRVASFEAHSDYIRSIAVHPSLTYVLTCSDDTTIKLWNWEKDWSCVKIFEGHIHYVMSISFNPRDSNTFASASLDRTIKVWSINGSGKPNYSLDGHSKGINTLSYFPGAIDKPYIASGADDKTIRIWDYQGRNCVRKLEGHILNVSSVDWGSNLPLLFSGSEDGTLRIWNITTFKCENSFKVGMGRIWCLAVKSNEIALGCDEGFSVFRLGNVDPFVSMVTNKIFWIKDSQVLSSTFDISNVGLTLSQKDLGSCELPLITAFDTSPTGRYLSVVSGSGDYVIYSSLGFRSKTFGKGFQIAWDLKSDKFAVLGNVGDVIIHSSQNFSETLDLKVGKKVDKIFGGTLLSLYFATESILSLYDWDTGMLIRTIEVSVKSVKWNPEGTLLAISAPDSSIYFLKYLGFSEDDPYSDEGYENSLILLNEVKSEIHESIFWLDSNTIIYVSLDKIKFCNLADETISVGVLPIDIKENNFIVGCCNSDSNCFIIFMDRKQYKLESFSFDYKVILFASALNSSNNDSEILALAGQLGFDARNKAIDYFEKSGKYQQALKLAANEPEILFRLYLKTKEFEKAFSVLEKSSNLNISSHHWGTLAFSSLSQWDLKTSLNCFSKVSDVPNLFFLNVMLGDMEEVSKLSLQIDSRHPLKFLSDFLLGNKDSCLDFLSSHNSSIEAEIFAKTFNANSIPTGNRSNSFDSTKKSVTRFKNSKGHQSTEDESFPPINSATSELDTLSMDVQTTGTGSLKGDDIDIEIYGIGQPPSEPIIEEEIEKSEFSMNNSEPKMFDDEDIEDPWKDI
jgi:coatomer subunit beta'